MKKFIFVVFNLLSLMALYSCSQDYDPVYSCDENVDSWVKSNMDDIKVMTRAEWKKLNPEVSIAVFRAFSPEQKILFWKQKFEEVKRLNWNDEELLHIIKAEDFLNANKEMFYGESATQEDLDKLDVFFYSWQKYAENNLKWDKSIIYSIVGSGQTLVDTKGTLKISGNITLAPSKMSTSSESGSTWDCNCQLDHVMACFPSGGVTPCEKSNCNVTNRGCGWMLLGNCTGRCGGSSGL